MVPYCYIREEKWKAFLVLYVMYDRKSGQDWENLFRLRKDIKVMYMFMNMFCFVRKKF